MRSALLILFFLPIVGSCQQGFLGVSTASTVPQSFAEFEARVSNLNNRRYSGNPIIVYEAATWKARQVHFPFIIENPIHTDSLIMFFGGGDVTLGSIYSVGRAVASKANPYLWVEYSGNPLFEPSDFGHGTIVGVDDAWWNPDENRFELICCTYISGQTYSWAGKYYSDDGFDFTYEGDLIGADGDEQFLGNCGILRDGATWYCAYTYRTVGGDVLPGVRIASSTDEGATWTKHGNFLTLGSAGAYDDKFMEGVQFLKIGSDYVLNYGCARDFGGGNIVFSGALASSTSALGTYTKSSINPFFEHSASGWDETQVSTIVLCTVTTPWLFFYQGASDTGPYYNALWSMGIAIY